MALVTNGVTALGRPWEAVVRPERHDGGIVLGIRTDNDGGVPIVVLGRRREYGHDVGVGSPLGHLGSPGRDRGGGVMMASDGEERPMVAAVYGGSSAERRWVKCIGDRGETRSVINWEEAHRRRRKQ